MLRIVSLLICISFVSFFQTTKKNKREKAIILTEEFIIRNGYTNLPFDTTKHKLDYELYDGLFSFDTLLKLRYNTLNPKALSVARTIHGWEVAFEYSAEYIKSKNRDSTGIRLVKINWFGKPRMAHLTYKRIEK